MIIWVIHEVAKEMANATMTREAARIAAEMGIETKTEVGVTRTEIVVMGGRVETATVIGTETEGMTGIAGTTEIATEEEMMVIATEEEMMAIVVTEEEMMATAAEMMVTAEEEEEEEIRIGNEGDRERGNSTAARICTKERVGSLISHC